MREKDEFPEFIRILKEKNDIVEVIGSYIKLERRGYSYWACCPFHHEKTPSFSVNTVDRYYHCFGCGASGDVIGFVKEYENVDFMQAVGLLAARVGLEVPARDDRAAEESALKKKKRDRLYALMKEAARFYLGNLYSGRAGEYLAYLEQRGISPSLAKKFGLGASLDYTGLPSFLLSAGYTPEECVESGACVRTEEGRLIDAEGGRLIIPIIDHMDEVVAFGGRVLGKTDRAKYKNTRETILFNKSKTLYNINLVKKEKRTAAIPFLIMVEGYMDAISLYKAGFKNVVASMGTSLTKEQARLCRRYTENVYISYDGDFAGQKANLRGLDILRDEGVKVRVVPMPEGLDPDDVIKQQGAEGYSRCLDAAMPLIDFRILSVQRKYDMKRTDEVRDFVREALSIVRESGSATEREELLKRISSVSGVSIGALQHDLESAPSPPPPREAEAKEKEEPADKELKAARFVLCACLLSKPYALGFDLSSVNFEDPVHKVIASYVTEARKQGRVRASGIFDLIPGEAELESVLNLDFGDNLDGAHAERYFRDCVSALRLAELNKKIGQAKDGYLSAATDEERAEHLKRLGEYTRMRKSIGGGGNI